MQHAIVLLEGVPVVKQHHHRLEAIQLAGVLKWVLVPIPLLAALDVFPTGLEACTTNQVTADVPLAAR